MGELAYTSLPVGEEMHPNAVGVAAAYCLAFHLCVQVFAYQSLVAVTVGVIAATGADIVVVDYTG